MATQRQKRVRSESIAFIGIVAGILVLVNILSSFFSLRFDVTKKDLFSLSEGSEELVAGLDDRMEIRAYFTEDLPAPHNATERYVRDLLAEYEAASDGNLEVRFIHPDSEEEKEQAREDNIPKVSDPSYQGDTFSVKEGYRGLAFHYLGETKTIPTISSTEGLEYQITRTIKELAGEKTRIGLVSGHGSPTLTEGLSSLKKLLTTYEIRSVDPAKPIDSELEAVLLVQPTEELSEQALENLDAYLMQGGALGLFGGTFDVELQQGPTASPTQTGINKLLGPWGIQMDDALVADAQCGRARMRTQMGIPMAVPYPPVPVVGFDQDEPHPIATNLDQVGLPFPAALVVDDTLKGDPDVRQAVLARSSKNSWLLTGDSIQLKAKPPEEWSMTGESGPHTLAATLEGKIPSAFGPGPVSSPEHGDKPEGPSRSEAGARVLVIGSGYFIRDEFLPQAREGQSPQMNSSLAFALNAVDWLAADRDLIAVRGKTVEEPALNVPQNVSEAEKKIQNAVEKQDRQAAEQAFEKRKAAIEAWDAKKTAYRWANTLGLPLAFALFGIVRWRMRKQKRANLKL